MLLDGRVGFEIDFKRRNIHLLKNLNDCNIWIFRHNDFTLLKIRYTELFYFFPFSILDPTKMAMNIHKWEKLSPSEFQQLQDLASCKFQKLAQK